MLINVMFIKKKHVIQAKKKYKIVEPCRGLSRVNYRKLDSTIRRTQGWNYRLIIDGVIFSTFLL